MSPLRVEPLATTGIGSLPHTQLEPALQLAFSLDIPHLPQLPRRDPAELLVPMALDGLPGLRWDAEGRCAVQLKEWRREAKAFEKRLDRALQKGELSPFEPQAGSCSAWKQFLTELEQREVRLAKAQLCGPITCVWELKLDDGRRAVDEAGLVEHVHRLVLARALAMARAMAAVDAAPILFFDEPGLVALDPRHPQHLRRLQELRGAVEALIKENARPGLHCCGNTKWSALLGLGLSYLSIDARLSLDAVLEDSRAFERFLIDGGRLALGVVPTAAGSTPEQAADIARGALASLARSDQMLRPSASARQPAKPASSAPGGKVLGQCLVTPACGLALRSVADAERVFAELQRGRTVLREALA